MRPPLRSALRCAAAAVGGVGAATMMSGGAVRADMAGDAAAASQEAGRLWNKWLAAADKDGDGNVSIFEAFTYGAEKTEKLARDVHSAIPWDELRQLTADAAVAVQQIQELADDAEKLIKQVHSILVVATRCIIEGSEAPGIEEMMAALPAPIRPMLRRPPIDEVCAQYMEECGGDPDKACDKFNEDSHSTHYVAAKRAMMLVPGGMAIAQLTETVTEIRVAAFTAAAFRWNVHKAKVQSQVLGCLAQVDMERMTQNAQLAKAGVDQADDAVRYVQKVTDQLDQGLEKVADQAGSLKARLYDAASGGDEVANQVARQVATKLIMMLKGNNDDTVVFAKQLFRDGPSAPPPKAVFRERAMPTWQVVFLTMVWTAALNSACCLYMSK